MPVRPPLALLALLLLGVPLLGGCEEDPSVIRTDLAFTLYGYLDPTADRQAIRVVPIAPTLGADTSLTLAATVTSIEQGSGRTAAWRDSVVTFADGSVGHVFVADYTPTPGATVDVVVTETGVPEPRSAAVEISVPPLARAAVLPASTSGAQVAYPVEIRGVPNVIGGTLRLYVTGFPGAPSDTTVLTVPEAGVGIEERSSGDWLLTVPFLSAARTFLEQQSLVGTLTLVAAEFGTFVANDAWAVPEGGFDLDAIVEPGTFSNVEGGFGFVGAGYEAPVRWVPSIATQSRAGFRITNDPASQLTLNEVSLNAGWVEIYNPTTEPIEVGGYRIERDPGDQSFEIEGRATISARGFLVVETGIDFGLDDRVSLVSPSDAEATFTFIASDGAGTASSYGSFPDGRRLVINLGQGIILSPFQGTLAPTPGEPNVLDFQPAFINEISTAGTDGWVEAVAVGSGVQVLRLQVGSAEESILEAPPATGATFPVADEWTPSLVLEQTGGEVFLLARYKFTQVDDERGEVFRVVDYRAYGPQDPTRSVGYLPDAPGGTWREGLVPTRGASNSATGRIAAR